VKRKTLCGEGNIYYAACLRNSGNILGSSIFEMSFMFFSYVPPLLVKQVWFSAAFSIGGLTGFLLSNYLDNREGTLPGMFSSTVSSLRATSYDFKKLCIFNIKCNFLAILRTTSYYFLYSSRNIGST